jgi:hypothetical protein
VSTGTGAARKLTHARILLLADTAARAHAVVSPGLGDSLEGRIGNACAAPAADDVLPTEALARRSVEQIKYLDIVIMDDYLYEIG